MLGEATTAKITEDRNSKGFHPLKQDAKEGGEVAGSTRKDIEKKTGKRISTRTNFLKHLQNTKSVAGSTLTEAPNKKRRKRK